MSKQASSTLIGAFFLGALILGIIVIFLLAGGQWFRERQQLIMYFEEASQGLQEGASVVFLGVRVGTVKRIQLGLDEKSRRFMVPVIIELDPHTVKTRGGEQIDLRDQLTISRLVDRGLRARLKLQSLLTGQRYIDLDLYPDRPARFLSDNSEFEEIPTIPTTEQELTTIFEDFPLAEFLADLETISALTKKLLSSKELTAIPNRLEATLSNIESLTARLDTAGGPLLLEAEANLVELHKAINGVQSAMAKIGTAADEIAALANSESPLYGTLSQISEKLVGTAETVRQLADEDSPTVQHLDMSLQEISRAARALRVLLESLEQQPEALFYGKRAKENNQ